MTPPEQSGLLCNVAQSSSDSKRLYEQTPSSPLLPSMASSPFLFISSSRSSLALARVITLAAANTDLYRPERDSPMREIEGARRKKVYSSIDRDGKAATATISVFAVFAGGDSAPRRSRGAARPHAVLRDGRGGRPHRHLHRRHSPRRPRRRRRQAQAGRSDYPG